MSSSSNSSTSKPVLLLTGSERKNNNATGISAYILSRWQQKSQAGLDIPSLILAKDLMPSDCSLPIGPVLGETITHSIKSWDQYPSKDVQEWSKVVQNSSAILIVTPQYNWGIPGHLKNLLDQLFNEYKEKRFLIVTYGGHGGSKCAEQLSMIIKGGFKANLIQDPIMITLPSDYIRSDRRVGHDGSDEFLKEYNDSIDQAIVNLSEHVAGKKE